MKKCSKCNLEKDILLFPKRGSICKNCQKIYNGIYYQNNKEKLKSDSVNFYHSNRDSVLNYKKDFYLENKDAKSIYNKIYLLNNRKAIREYQNNYSRDKRRSDPSFRLKSIVSTRIFKVLKKQNSSKNNESCSKYLPYTFDELRVHLESLFEEWMNWNNYGRYGLDGWIDDDITTWTWTIDHVIPQSKLPYTSMDDDNFNKCWALENLRPLSAKQNVIDGNRR
jgi:hypothetical protein